MQEHKWFINSGLFKYAIQCISSSSDNDQLNMN
jgi:hypothetical protein